VAVNNSIMVGPLVFLLYMSVIKGNITKRPVFRTSVKLQSTFIVYINYA